MSRQLNCPEGHSWPATAEEFHCPVCGAVALDCPPGKLTALLAAQDTGVPPPPSPLPAGMTAIADKLGPPEAQSPPVIPGYDLLALLGRGGMGMVYQARQRALDRLVALKIIHPELLADPEAVRRFQREARVAARLSHPNVVTVYDAGEAGGTHFLVMELVEGADLSRLLARRGHFPAVEACDCVRQAALGLQHAHERDLVHRDIKPSNLLLTPQGQVKLLDLGLARLRPAREGQFAGSVLTQSGVFMGTPDYLAPEQALDPRTADIRADIYSLGCTLFHLLTGRPPFPGDTLAQKLLRHQQEEPPGVEALCPDLPAGLGDVVRQALAKQPKDRFPTPAEFADALVPYARSSAEQVTPRPPAHTTTLHKAPPQAKARRSHPVLLTAVAGGLLLLAVLLWQIWGGSPAPSRQPFAEVVNSIDMRLVRIPAGSFWMGASDQEARDPGNDNEQPRHEVTITKEFYMGVFEVTQGEYEAVMGRNPAYFAGPKGGPDHPVEQVSWNQAVEFCAKLSARPAELKAGRSYRLPTEAEWEYACRAGTPTPFHFGPTMTSHQASFDGRKPYPAPPLGTVGPELEGTTPVGKYPHNDFGLYDMHGNVIEWCADYYDSGYYKKSPSQDPPGPRFPGMIRVVRGGGWENDGVDCRAAKRGDAFGPTDSHRSLGFRVVCVLAAPR